MPAPDLPKRYFLLQDDEESGPFSLAHLQGLWRRKVIREDAFFWLEGDPEWQSITVLRECLDPRPLEISAPNVTKRRQKHSAKKKKQNLRGLTIGFVVILVILGVVAGLIYMAGQFL